MTYKWKEFVGDAKAFSETNIVDDVGTVHAECISIPLMREDGSPYDESILARVVDGRVIAIHDGSTVGELDPDAHIRRSVSTAGYILETCILY